MFFRSNKRSSEESFFRSGLSLGATCKELSAIVLPDLFLLREDYFFVVPPEEISIGVGGLDCLPSTLGGVCPKKENLGGALGASAT